MMLITIMKWYCEFLGSKAVSGTTAYSEVLNSFCNVDNSSINASFYTDEIELQALVELIGIQGAHFLDEQLLKMFMSSTVAIADISALHASLLANINFKATPAQLKETIKKIPGNVLIYVAILEFIDHAKTLAIVAQFRDLLSKAVSNVSIDLT